MSSMTTETSTGAAITPQTPIWRIGEASGAVRKVNARLTSHFDRLFEAAPRAADQRNPTRQALERFRQEQDRDEAERQTTITIQEN